MAKSPSKIVLGIEPYLGPAMRDWAQAEPHTTLIPVPVTQDEFYRFDFSTLADYSPETATAFIAWSDQFLNLRRYELYLQMKKMGFAMPSLIHPMAQIANDAQISEHCWINQGAQVASGVKIGANVVVGFGVAIHAAAHIGENVMIGDGSVICNACKIGTFVTIGSQVFLDAQTKIGGFSRLTKAGTYRGTYKEGMFIEERFEAAIIS